MPNTPKEEVFQEKYITHLDRQKIRNILNEISIPKSMGVIVRTAGSNKTKNEIEKIFEGTLQTWEEIKEKALDSNALPLLFMKREIL